MLGPRQNGGEGRGPEGAGAQAEWGGGEGAGVHSPPVRHEFVNVPRIEPQT